MQYDHKAWIERATERTFFLLISSDHSTKISFLIYSKKNILSLFERNWQIEGPPKLTTRIQVKKINSQLLAGGRLFLTFIVRGLFCEHPLYRYCTPSPYYFLFSFIFWLRKMSLSIIWRKYSLIWQPKFQFFKIGVLFFCIKEKTLSYQDRPPDCDSSSDSCLFFFKTNIAVALKKKYWHTIFLLYQLFSRSPVQKYKYFESKCSKFRYLFCAFGFWRVDFF